MNDRFLEEEYFPEKMKRLRECGEVYIEFAYSPQFSHYLKRTDYDLWMATEQAALITDDGLARFYTRA